MAELETHSAQGSKGVNPSMLILVKLVIWESWIQNEKGRLEFGEVGWVQGKV